MTFYLAPLLALSMVGNTATSAPPTPPLKTERLTGSRIPQPVEEALKEQQIRTIQVQYGKCVVDKHYAVARNYVLTPELEKKNGREVLSKLADGWCLSAAAAAMDGIVMKFPADGLRYTLAEALVRRDFASTPPSVSDAGAVVQPVFDEAEFVLKPGSKPKQKDIDQLAESRSRRIATVFLAEFGECVVRADASSSLALVRTAPETGEERGAFKRMQPAFAGCLFADENLTFTKSMLRGAIAMNLYRLGYAPRVSASAGATR